jgi:predicted negative regulator of RcsB-dependent stress response
MSSGLPVILIEVVLVFGGTLAFGWWQLRSVKRDSEAARRETEAAQAREAADGAEPPQPPGV